MENVVSSTTEIKIHSATFGDLAGDKLLLLDVELVQAGDRNFTVKFFPFTNTSFGPTWPLQFLSHETRKTAAFPIPDTVCRSNAGRIEIYWLPPSPRLVMDTVATEPCRTTTPTVLAANFDFSNRGADALLAFNPAGDNADLFEAPAQLESYTAEPCQDLDGEKWRFIRVTYSDADHVVVDYQIDYQTFGVPTHDGSGNGAGGVAMIPIAPESLIGGNDGQFKVRVDGGNWSVWKHWPETQDCT